MPGSRFAVLAHPEPRLVRLGPDTTLPGPEFGTWMLVAKGQMPADWVTATLAPAERPGLRSTRRPPTRRWWALQAHRVPRLPARPVGALPVGDLRTPGPLPLVLGIDATGHRCVFCSATPPDSGERPRHARELPEGRRPAAPHRSLTT
ncbi:putative protein OS=Streptomyces fumanus OX=67302 GN=GCM10018772_41660 PE=4 SV=1 [Streptomyces fumanus]